MFYTRFEFGRRLGLFYGSYGIAGALGGVLAFVVFSRFPSSPAPEDNTLENTTALKPWQILFLIEGLLTILIAVIGFFWLPHSAGSAWFLSPEERKWAELRIRDDRKSDDDKSTQESTFADEGPENTASLSPEAEQRRGLLSDEESPRQHSTPTLNFSSDAGLSRHEVLSTILFLPLVFPTLLLNIASAIPSTGFSVFLPLVLSSLSLSSPLHSNILTVPPFLLASATLFVFTYWSDKSRQRIVPILASLGIIILGLVLTLMLSGTPLSSPEAVALYFSLCILLSGSFIPSPLTVAWFSGNIPDPGKRAIVLGVNGYGNLAGVLAALIFSPRWQTDAYRIPFLVTLGFVVASFIGYVMFWVVIRLTNQARARCIAQGLGESDNNNNNNNISTHGSGNSRGWSSTDGLPVFAVVGGTWWDSWARYWIGKKLFGMDDAEVYVRRGDEKLAFRYGL